jgi:hypothetical protein
MNKLIPFILIFGLQSCTSEKDPFAWIKTLPNPWTLSESEFESFLPQFHEQFPNYHERLIALNLWRVGTPYGLFCLGEESGKDTDPLIRVDSSDCTVHVLTTLAFAESFTWQNCRDAMVDIHYKMDQKGQKKPSYKTRWHYTSDRLLHHERTVDITQEIATENDLEIVEIELNKKQDGLEFLDLEWSSIESIQFIPSEKINTGHLEKLPNVCGVAFVKKKLF